MIGDVVIDPQMKDHVLSWAKPFMVVVRRLEPAVKLLVQWDHVMGLCNRFESTTSPLQTHPRCPQFQIPVVVERKPATGVRTRQTRCRLVGRVYGVSLRDRAVSSAETPATPGFPPSGSLCRVLDYAEHPALCVGSLKESNSLARVTRHNHRVARNAISLSVGL